MLEEGALKLLNPTDPEVPRWQWTNALSAEAGRQPGAFSLSITEKGARRVG